MKTYFELNKENNDNIELASTTVYQAPDFKSEKNKEWVPFLDTDNTQYPDKLIYYKNNSSLHGAIIRNMSDQVAGNGFQVEDSSAMATTADWLNKISKNGEDATELLAKIADDLVTFKGFALLITWSKDGSRILYVDHVDFSKLRSAKVDDNGKIPGYYYSWNWNTQRPNRVFIPAFDTNTMAEKKKQYNEAIEKATMNGSIVPELNSIYTSPTEQILYFHPYASNEFYYPLPYYVAAINAINTDILTDQYGVSAMENGLSANHIVNFKGNYTPEQKKQEARRFVNTYVNNSKKLLPIIVFSKDAESSVDITSVATNSKDERYTSINENATQKILSGHGVTSPLLVGIREPGSLGGSEEIKNSAELFFKNTIRPKQNAITKVFNGLLNINEMENVYIEKMTVLEDNNEIDGTPETVIPINVTNES